MEYIITITVTLAISAVIAILWVRVLDKHEKEKQDGLWNDITEDDWP